MTAGALHEDSNGSGKTHMNDFPAYAAWLLANFLDDFTRELLRLGQEEQIPLLKQLASLSESELYTLSHGSSAKLLGMLAANQSDEFIRQSTESFISNNIGSIDRDSVVIEDITLVALVRRRAFRSLLRNYTTDTTLFFSVMEEVDRFTATSEAAAFHAYHKVQQGKFRDINGQLAQQQEELLEAQALAEMGSFFWNIKEGTSIYSRGALEIFGLKDHISREHFMENISAGDAARIMATIDKVLNEGGMYECEFSYIVNAQEKRIWSRGIVHLEDGKAASMRGSIRDITKKYLLMESLRQSEELHNQAQALTHIGNWSWDIRGNKILWSDEMYRIFGLEPQSEEITFERFMSLFHPDDREHRKLQIERSLKGVSEDYLLRIITPAGITKTLKGKGEIIKDIDASPIKIIGTCQDITREQQLHQELQEKEQNFRQLIHSAPDSVIVINEDNIITLWNPKTASVFGWTIDEAIGRSLSETIIPTHSRQGHEQGMKRLLKTGEARILNKTLELTACNKKGEELYISLTVSETMQRGGKAFIAFIRDISEQKAKDIELESKRKQLETSNQQLELSNQQLEQFAYIASHDLQEPLRKIRTFGDLLSNYIQTEADAKKYVSKITSSAERMSGLIHSLLDYSTATNGIRYEKVDLNETITAILSDFELLIVQKKAQVDFDNLPIIKAVPLQMNQLFYNLIGNSLKFTKRNTIPRITITSNEVSALEKNAWQLEAHTDYVEIVVRDSGIGFDQNYANKVFTIFQRLNNRSEYGGYGIGLALCKKVVDAHKGRIFAEGKLNVGATFKIILPVE